MQMRWFERIEETLIALLLAVMTLVTFAQVIARYFFHYSFGWALEFSTFVFGALIFLGLGWGIRENAHIGVSVLVDRLPGAVARWAALLATALCLVYAGLVLVGSWVYVKTMYQIGVDAQDLPIPLWVPITVVPIGYAIFAARLLGVLREVWTGRRRHLLGDEAEDALAAAERPGEKDA